MKFPLFPCILLCTQIALASSPTDNGNQSEGVLGNMLSYRYTAIKTNILYDAIGVLNLGAELELTSHITVELPVAWSFWDWEEDKGLRILALQPGIRYYTGHIGSGHAFGIDLYTAWFNMRNGTRRYQDTGRPLLGAGISYSYTLPLTSNWRAEFLIGAGYFNTRYHTYHNISNGARIMTRTRNYLGPTRLAISLVYSL